MIDKETVSIRPRGRSIAQTSLGTFPGQKKECFEEVRPRRSVSRHSLTWKAILPIVSRRISDPLTTQGHRHEKGCHLRFPLFSVPAHCPASLLIRRIRVTHGPCHRQRPVCGWTPQEPSQRRLGHGEHSTEAWVLRDLEEKRQPSGDGRDDP